MPEPIITLEDAKAHIRVMHDDEDAAIEEMIAVAEEACRAFLGLEEDATDPAALPLAVKIHVAALYEDREGGTMPEAAADLLRPYRTWTVA